MFDVFSCLFEEHDLRFVAAAVVICAASLILTVRLLSRIRSASRMEKVEEIVNGAATIELADVA
jgi:NO-binding membrane sensor protein with MHYT domain